MEYAKESGTVFNNILLDGVIIKENNDKMSFAKIANHTSGLYTISCQFLKDENAAIIDYGDVVSNQVLT